MKQRNKPWTRKKKRVVSSTMLNPHPQSEGAEGVRDQEVEQRTNPMGFRQRVKSAAGTALSAAGTAADTALSAASKGRQRAQTAGSNIGQTISGAASEGRQRAQTAGSNIAQTIRDAASRVKPSEGGRFPKVFWKRLRWMSALFLFLVTVLMIRHTSPVVRNFIEQRGTWIYTPVILGILWLCSVPVILSINFKERQPATQSEIVEVTNKRYVRSM